MSTEPRRSDTAAPARRLIDICSRKNIRLSVWVLICTLHQENHLRRSARDSVSTQTLNQHPDAHTRTSIGRALSSSM